MSSSNHLLVDKPKYVIQAMDTHLLVPSPLAEEEDGLGYQNTLNNVLRRFQENSQTPLELAQKLSNDGYLFYCVPQTLATTLDEMNVDELKPYPKGNAKGFVKYLDEWMGFA